MKKIKGERGAIRGKKSQCREDERKEGLKR